MRDTLMDTPDHVDDAQQKYQFFLFQFHLLLQPEQRKNR